MKHLERQAEEYLTFLVRDLRNRAQNLNGAADDAIRARAKLLAAAKAIEDAN